MPSLAKPALLLTATLALTSCHRTRFPTYADDYREFAYVTSGAANTVTVLDLVYLRQDRVLEVGRNPSGLALNPVRNEVYAVNTGSDSVSVINTSLNRVDATIGVHRTPYMIEVAPDGRRAYVPNTASNTVSVLDLDTRREIANIGAGEAPGVARVTPDNRTLVVSNRTAGSVSLYTINATDKKNPLTLRGAYAGCPGATDVLIAPNSPGYPDYGARAFIACSGGHQVMDLWLRTTPEAARQKQDPTLAEDHLLGLLDVGKTPYHLAMKPDATEIFSTNFDSDSVSEISIYTNEVEGTYVIGSKPTSAVISHDNSSLWVSNFGADSASLYDIDDARMVTGVRTGSHPDALAFSHDEHLLLIANSGSADIAVFRTDSASPSLVTLLPSGPHPNDLVVKQFSAKDKK